MSYEGPLLSVQELGTTFVTARGRVRAVDGVSFDLEQSRTLGLVGESGSGKTVLVRSIMGLLPTASVERSGKVLLEGRDLAGLSKRELRDTWGTRHGARVPGPHDRAESGGTDRSTAHGIPPHPRGTGPQGARETAITLLKSVGIPDPERRLRAYPHELSGGMRQRVMIAISIACSPRLLLADEPTTGLDVTVQAQILELLRSLQQERSMSMILVTHDLAVVAGSADEIAVMYAGRIVEHAPTEVLLATTRMPYTEALLRSVPKLSQPSHTRLRAIPGRPPDLARLSPGCAFAPRCAYASERCWREAPPLRNAGTGHRFACWNPVGSPEGAASLAANVEAGLPSAKAHEGFTDHLLLTEEQETASGSIT